MNYLEIVRYLTDVVQIQVLQNLDLAIAVSLPGRLLCGGGATQTVIASLVAI
jgi:hypothetical protein